MKRIFSIDGEVYGGLSFLYKMIQLNVFFLLGSIPIVTIGTSFIALYQCVGKIQRKEDGVLFNDFLSSYKNHLKQGIQLFFIQLFLFILSFILVFFSDRVWQQSILTLFSLLLFVIVVFVTVYSYLLLSQFHHTVKQTLINSFLLVLKNVTIAIIIFSIPLLLLVVPPLYFPKIFFGWFFLAMSCTAFIQMYFFSKVIREFRNDAMIYEEGSESQQ